MNPKINPCISSKSRPEKIVQPNNLSRMINAIRVAKPKAFAAWLEINPVKSSPVSENSFHLIHKIRMVSRAETGEDRLTDVRGKLRTA